MATLDAALAQVPALAPLAGKIGLGPALIAPPDAPTVTLPADEVAAYAGRYADPGQVLTFAMKSEGPSSRSSRSTSLGRGSRRSSSDSTTVPVAFLAEDMAVVNGVRLPFVRDPDGQVQWVSSGLRLVPASTRTRDVLLRMLRERSRPMP